MESLGSRTERLRRATLVIVAVATTCLFAWMISEFIMALLLAAIFAAMFHPWYRWILPRVKSRRRVAAMATVGCVTLGIVLPATGFLVMVASQVVHFGTAARPWVEANFSRVTQFDQLMATTPGLAFLKPYQSEIAPKLGEWAGSISSWAIDFVTTAATETATVLLLLFVMLYAMYFFLLQGRSALSRMLYYLPLPAEDEERMVERFISVARATIKGTLVIGFVQGALGGVGFAFVGIEAAALWATVMAILSVIPGLGAMLVWIPVVVSLAFQQRWGACIGLFAWCAGVVGTIDNVLRPWLVGKDTKLPDLLILVATLGGLTVFGAIGIILGPIVAALFITVWDLYGAAFRDVLPPPPESPPSIPSPRLISLNRD
ncbi:MAG TPA: AI-2E family transporter [Polyangiaceae bacterium]|nr:AI-2E family transporter [Polyangiaceae bacterium]